MGDATEFVRALASRDDTFDRPTLEGLREARADAAAGTFRAVLDVTPRVANRFGTLHGGCIATLVDVIGTAALVTKTQLAGVSVEINVSYMGSAKLGEEVEVVAKVLKVGSSLATVQVDLRTTRSGRAVAQGRHTKFVALASTSVEPGSPHAPRAKL